MTYTHVSAPTQFIDANSIRFAYRRFGTNSGVPLLFMQHFRGGMDHSDPSVTDGFAKDRPVILFNNAGVPSSSGATPQTIDAMADRAAGFVAALGLSKFDLHIPNAQLIIYPDSGHASHFQYPDLFLTHARAFLDR